MSDTEVVDGEAEEIGTEIVVTQHQQANLFRTDDPVDVLERATRVAQALKSVIDKQNLVSKIQGREHVRVEGWTTLGSMLGVVPVVEWTRKTDDGDGWEARVVAQTLDGRTIGAAEAMCTKGEGKPWNSRPDYALRSMAQTRATSKALRGPLGFVVTLAGYESTPAEEMPTGEASAPDGPPFGPALPDAHQQRVGQAIHTLLLDPETGVVPDVAGVADRIIQDAGGYFPRIVARALLHLEKALTAPTPAATGDES